MRSAHLLSSPALAGAHARKRHQPLAWLSARLRGPWLDRQLAAGVAPWHSPAHAARALQLTSNRHRRATARSLERLVELADQPHTRFLSAAVPPCREQIHDALASILHVAARLRDGGPLTPGVSRWWASCSQTGWGRVTFTRTRGR